jgi:4-hydroxy-2-oxoheptanedioate aldolase
LIGPHDFSVSHNIPEQYDHPIFNEAARTVIQTCREHNVGVGIHFIAGDVDRELRWIAWGCNFIVHRSDTSFMANGIKQEIGGLREMLEEDVPIASPAIGASGHAA